MQNYIGALQKPTFLSSVGRCGCQFRRLSSTLSTRGIFSQCISLLPIDIAGAKMDFSYATPPPSKEMNSTPYGLNIYSTKRKAILAID